MAIWLKNKLLRVLIWTLLVQAIVPFAAMPVYAESSPVVDALPEPSLLGLSDLRIVRVQEIAPPPAAPRAPLPALTSYGPILPSARPLRTPIPLALARDQDRWPPRFDPFQLPQAVGVRPSTNPSADPETDTDDAGRYQFEGLPHGTHRVTLDASTLPPDLRPADGEQVPVLWLNPGMRTTSYALLSGVRLTAEYDRNGGAIAGVVFVDADGDGEQDDGEPGVPGVRIIDPTLHQYFVPFDDRDLWVLFEEKVACHATFSTPYAVQPLISFVFLTAGSDGTIYYYDHWEDGYDADPLDPGPTTEVGMVDAGGTRIFQSDIDPTLIPSPGPNYYYDGRDRISILGEQVSLVRMAYPSIVGGIYDGVISAAAWEVSEVADWGTDYVAIVGQDLDFNGPVADDHDYAGLEVMAWRDNTAVYYNGVLTATLDAGEVYSVTGGALSYDTITATASVQVQMMTGACGDYGVSANGYTLQPVNVWDTAYWAPVPGFEASCTASGANADTDIYLHNPHGNAITVTVVSGAMTADVTIPAGQTISVITMTGWVDLSTGFAGTHLFSSQTFGGIVVVDSTTADGATFGRVFDWGYSLIPESQLSSQAVVGYAPGTGATPPADNSNVAFVTAVTDTIIYVDLNQDGLADPVDLNGDGDADDNDAWGVAAWDEPLSALGIPLQAGQSLRIGDPGDHDLMGALIYTLNLQDKIAVAWGQDPCQSVDAFPSLDLGYTILPVPVPRLSKVDELAIDADLTGDVSPGDTITYVIVLYNNGLGSMNNVVLTDTLPHTYTDFVAGSLQIATPPPTRAVEYSADSLTWGSTPLSNAQAFRIAWDTIGPGQTVTITFRIVLNASIPATVTQITNEAVVSSDETDLVISEDPQDPFDPDTDTDIGRPALALDKRVSTGVARPGERITYSIVLSNTGNGIALGIVLSDVLPVGIQYVPGTLNITWPVAQVETITRTVTRTTSFHGTYADDLDLTLTQTTNYAGSDGSLAWSTDWIEVNDDLSGLPTAGEVQVQTVAANALSAPAYLELTNIDSDDAGVSRMVDLSLFSAPVLRYYVYGETNDGDDTYRVDVNGVPGLPQQYNGGWTLRQVPLTGGAMATVSLIATAGLEPDDTYRFDNLAIYESDPERVLTQTLTWESVTITYATASGLDPIFGPVDGSMVFTQGLRLLPGAALTVTFQAQVSLPMTNGLVLTNTACFSSVNAFAGCDDEAVRILSSHALTLTKTGQPAPVAPGGLLTYTLVYTAAGDDPAPNVIITDATPAGTTFVHAAGGMHIDVPPSGATGVITWHLGTLLTATSGITWQTGVVTLVVQVDPGLTSGPILNWARISDDSGVWDDDDESTPLLPPVADLVIVKVDDPDPASAGGVLTYTLVYTNAGPSDAQNVIITDTLPLSVTWGGVVSQPPGWSVPPDYAPGPPATLAWYTPTLRVGDWGRIVLTVTVDVQASGTLTNHVTITSTTSDPDPGNNNDDEPTGLITLADLAIAKADNPDPVPSGAVLTYTLVYTNYGPSNAQNVYITDTLPLSVAMGGVVEAAPPLVGPVIAGGRLTWYTPTLSAGATGRIVLTVTVHAGVNGLITNSVTITSATPDDNPGNNDDDEPTAPMIPGLEMVKTVQPDRVVRHMPFTYTIRITNTGYVVLDPLVLTDTLPPDTYYVAGTGLPLAPDVVAPPTLVWSNLGPLAAGASITVSFAATATPGLTGTYTNGALAEGSYPGGTVTDTDDVPILIADPAVEIQKQVVAIDTDLVAPNYVTFTIIITNVGPSVIGVLPLVDQYDPYYLSFADATPYPEQDEDDGAVTWNDLTGPAPHGFNRNLPPGESFVITTVFRVAHNINVTTTNVATVTGAIDLYENPANDDVDDQDIGGEDDGIPTPITLLYLRAVAEDGAVRVRWATIAELGTVGFDLYRAGSERWEVAEWIAYVPATGSGSTYDYIDARVEPGQWYWYWLV
ncbi:MAG: DUF11 domain-containing protein, partial [Anaerolineae bacterium]|nr:DUF11 domain-containing protein [Anaerolineae bacterium]